MDFFERQTKSQRNTKLLVFYFAAAVVLIVLSVYLVAVGIFLYGNSRYHVGGDAAFSFWHPQLFLGVTLGTLAVIFGGSAWRISELSQGGSSIATMLGGRLVSPTTTDPDERKLLNVVEEMAIASGTPVPQVFVLPDERGINAFAAGHSTSDMVIAVTRGGMKLLTRDELQGVIGHEFSHILNGDMRLNLRLIGIVFGIMGLAFVGRILLQTRSRSSRDRSPLPFLGLALLLIGWIGVLFGRLIQSAVSRQREFLADASSVQFTRNPDGLAGALKKIGGAGAGSELAATRAPEASHMFFANGMKQSLFSLFQTHPPLVQRIRAIEPNWDGQFPTVRWETTETAPVAAAVRAQPPRLPPIFGNVMRPQPAAAGLAPSLITAAALSQSVGTPLARHLDYAADWCAKLPQNVDAAAREPLRACALIFAMLLSPDAAQRQKQLDALRTMTPAEIHAETLRLLPDVAAMGSRARLPLVNLALPTLRSLSAPQYEQFTAAMQALIESDGQIDWFEYVLQKIVRRHLEPQFRGARKTVIQYYALQPLKPDCSFLLSVLANAGQEESAKIEAAFRAGWRELRAPETNLQVLAITECDLKQLDATLDRLAQASPPIKRTVLNACAQTVTADGVIREEEAELLRAISDTLDCPIPPFVQGV